MTDIKLNSEGDIAVSNMGDISLTESICQAVLVRLRWIYGEWRLGPEFGFAWFENVFVKSPNLERICSLIRTEIMDVEGVKKASVSVKAHDKKKREVIFAYTFSTDDETYNEEVTLYG